MANQSSTSREKTTVKTIKALKGERPIVAITAYDALMTRLIDDAVDLILVGDSMGNTALGYENTVNVTLDTIIHHAAAVNRAQPKALVIADIPFGDAYLSSDSLLLASRRLMQEAGVQAVKIEVGSESLFPKIENLINAGIPVMGHIGLLPQTINALGSYRSYGNREAGRMRLINWAQQLESIGCFSVLGEMIKPEAAGEITKRIDVPFIGIGCGVDCDGQILVLSDVLGLSPDSPFFAKQYVDLSAAIKDAVANYASEVTQKQFPQK